ncbi:FliA/WhiG family RNA polymerase sigma factor [Ectopseudomonas hydrolytica]|jgi:RNA polymerase sigma factor for flagellar operon FliA|uniref:RNA polymerase, sigma 28 subunit, SigD/FliA/WhiG n=1 Tax=Ectopseudomonas mendocina (strain ymp) TaxID=399739 RepID=A4XNP9_ECTM1|nr:FliA/WhiG family RNA polymerase sigma factor [Pseudomonas hydrolytica]MBF8160335.1 FliA/WhiG family RNA polymerase sigma factor [Pseudomonas mendocina]UTH31901.1 FliA/WhiG family RNA polymerase sigma factor [Pseudomonas hydrolytica]UZZ11078.1 FliA/WhiG family RNA polymerase sigma factor [Pseudomonas mendocina]
MNATCAIDYRYAAEQGGAALFAPGAEQKWLLQYLPLVKRIVSQLALQANQVLDREDMEQIGLMGLLECLRRYGTPDEQFGRFAALRIRGAILDELRRQDWRPRQVRQQTHRIRDAIRQLARQLGRVPQEEEILAAAGIDAKTYQEFLQADACEAIESLDELLQSGHEGFVCGASAVEERVLKERLLTQALSQLSERERLVLTLYYQHELSLKEIALVLELSDARVCQLSKQAIAKASRYLNERG